MGAITGLHEVRSAHRLRIHSYFGKWLSDTALLAGNYQYMVPISFFCDLIPPLCLFA